MDILLLAKFHTLFSPPRFLPNVLFESMINFILKSSFWFPAKFPENYDKYTLSLSDTAAHAVNILHGGGTIIIVNEPFLTHYNYPKFTVSIIVHS